MRIVEGNLPRDLAWRALVMVSPGEDLGITWQLGLSLAIANMGELITAAVVSPGDDKSLMAARELLERADELSAPDDPVYTVLIESDRYSRAVRDLIKEADIDLLLARADAAHWPNLERMPCAIAAVRGEAYGPRDDEQDLKAEESPRFEGRILVPTSGGPNSVHALSILLPLTRHDIDITALYIASEHKGETEVALGKARLRQTLDFIDGQGKIESRLVTASNIVDGIVKEVGDDYDLIVIGASRESSLDKVLFGDITGTVVRQSRTPAVVFRQPTSRVGHLFTDLNWTLQRVFPRINLQERTQAYVRIRRDARPNLDFYVLIGLAAAIAALGMLADSPAVVIGAMLVAPLMSPIAGTGLAMVRGDMRFLRLSLAAVLRGSFIALLMGLLAGLIPLKDNITDQVLARTSPTLLDLGVALLSGMAVAYALSRSSAMAALPGVAIAAALVPPLAAAGISLSSGHVADGLGALILYITNFIAISVASAVVFLVLGFRPYSLVKEKRVAGLRSAQAAVILLVVITGVLAFTTYQLAQASAREAYIRELATDGVEQITGAKLEDIEIDNLEEGGLQLDLVVRSSRSIPHSSVVDLQEYLAAGLQEDTRLILTVIETDELDALSPPTFTPSPTQTPIPTNTVTKTPTLVPTDTPTVEPTDTATPSPSPTMTDTPTPEPTSTATLTPTPTPRTAVVGYEYGLNLRAEPDSQAELIGFLPAGTLVVLLDGLIENVEGTWQHVEYNGQAGWILGDFLGDASG